MKSSIYLPEGTISSKKIPTEVPYSEKVDTRTFSRLLDDNKVVASYKMYWLLGILEEVNLGNIEIEFKKLVARIIVYAWYPHTQYKLSFGSFDNLKKSINYIVDKYKFKSNCNEKELLEFLCSINDNELHKMMKDLTLKVPYRLLSPFFSSELKRVKDQDKNKLIEHLTLASDRGLYKIINGDKDYTLINDG